MKNNGIPIEEQEDKKQLEIVPRELNSKIMGNHSSVESQSDKLWESDIKTNYHDILSPASSILATNPNRKRAMTDNTQSRKFVTFVDQINGGNVGEIIMVESYKQYNSPYSEGCTCRLI